MGYRIFQDEQTWWDIKELNHVRYFILGAWVQNGGSIEEASLMAEYILDELLYAGNFRYSIGTQPYTFVML